MKMIDNSSNLFHPGAKVTVAIAMGCEEKLRPTSGSFYPTRSFEGMQTKRRDHDKPALETNGVPNFCGKTCGFTLFLTWL